MKTDICCMIACWAAAAAGFFAVVLLFVVLSGGSPALAGTMLGMAVVGYIIPMFIFQAKKAALNVLELEEKAELKTQPEK